jgi:hypothetical protein
VVVVVVVVVVAVVVVGVVVIRASMVVELDVDVDRGALLVQLDIVVVIGDVVEAVVRCLHSSWRSWLWQSSARWWLLSWGCYRGRSRGRDSCVCGS